MTDTLFRWVSVAGACALAACASGCANLYLHSDTRQQQAEAMTKAWAEVEHATLFATERENLAKLAQAEEQTQLRVAAAKREHLAAVITASATEGESAPGRTARSVASVVVKGAQSEFTALVGPLDGYDKRVKAADELAPIENSIAGLGVRMQVSDSPVGGCADLGDGAGLPAKAQQWLDSLTGAARTGARDSLRTLRDDCVRLDAKKAEQRANGVDAAPLGKMKAAIAQRDADRRELALQRTVFQNAKARYDAALAQYVTAEDAARAPAADETAAAKVAKAAETLRTEIGLLRGLNNAFAKEFIGNETLDSIDGSLSAIAAGKAADDAKKGVVFAVQAPSLIDRYRAALAESKKPLVLPLLIRRNAEQLQRDAAAADVKLVQAKVETSEQIVAAVQAEAAALRRAIRELEQARKLNASALDQPWAEALAATSGKSKQLLLSGTARYLDAVSRLQGERYQLEYARIALDHQRGLAYAETSVAQWANLIGAGVGQLDAFAKGGIDKAVLSDIAKIIGVFWIGHGVNK
ncbi:MAG TPA: hypothetical protein VLJ62_28465 [Burkholderiaceae bacterium]|nr:hypothetical protein [Burkholderiaceae bacterium]